MFKVINDEGRAFNVRLLTKGMRYGRQDCLTNDRDDPIIEFYDAAYEADPKYPDWIERGQFASSYYLYSLEGHSPDHGLILHGGIPEWTISAKNVIEAVTYCKLLLSLGESHASRI